MTVKIKTAQSSRIYSVDALRGFDMFWILGAERIFAGLFLIFGWAGWQVAAQQMTHSAWHGFTAYDLIFPLFIFLSGVSLGLSADKFATLNSDEKLGRYRHAIKRLILLFVLGVIYNHGWGGGMPADLNQVRYASVLARIGLAWFVAAMVVWHCRLPTQIIISAALLLGYWLLQHTWSSPTGPYGPEDSINAWVDQLLLPGIRYQNLAVDPEGLLSNLGSIVNAILGAFAGRWLVMRNSMTPQKLLFGLVGAGILMIALGYLWDVVLPINKTLWTSSFVLVTAGWSALLLALFYGVIDVLKWQRWAFIFGVIGMNSIVIYLATSLVKWTYLSSSLFGGLIAGLDPSWQPLMTTIAWVGVQVAFVYWLYRHKIFIRI